MADNESGADDRTEEASPERREEFREKGQVVVSRELSSVMILGACIIFFTYYMPMLMQDMRKMLVAHFETIATRRVNQENVLEFAFESWKDMLIVIVPVFLVPLIVSIVSTFAQTRLNWSWKRVAPDWSRLGMISGLARLANMQAAVELLKSIAKMFAVGLVAYLILFSEWAKVPELMAYPIPSTWIYWGGITKQMFWAVAGLLLVVAGFDYLYNFVSYERKIRMTKQEVKEEYKKRESDPHVKNRMRRMQREAASRKVVAKTKTATVLITNPTHYSIALKYDLGDGAPIIVAKGVDFLALKMREVAREEKIPIIENRPLARALYAQVEEGEEIPDKFYKAIAEIIRYVFKLKGRRLPSKSAKPTPPPAPAPMS